MLREKSSTLSYKKLCQALAMCLLVAIFPLTFDVDSLCTLSMYPVYSDEFHEYVVSASRNNSSVSMMVLLNWDCDKNLWETLKLDHLAAVSLIDSHRLIQMSNLTEGNKHVIVYNFEISLTQLANHAREQGLVSSSKNYSVVKNSCNNHKKEFNEYYVSSMFYGKSSGYLLFNLIITFVSMSQCGVLPQPL